MNWKRQVKQHPAPALEEQARSLLAKELPKFVPARDAKVWRRQSARLRRAALDKVYLRGIERKIIDAKPRVVWGGTLEPDASYRIRKLRYEAYPGYWVPALLYEPVKLRGRVPVVLNPNGHHRGGKAAHYKQARCANLARRGMIALNFEFVGMSELQADMDHYDLGLLNLVGISGVGLFYLAMNKGLDVLLQHRHADRKRVAMTGLSGGGWQTIVLGALDPRVTVSVPVAGYTTLRNRIHCLEDRGDLEQMPTDLATVLDFDTMTALLAPRPALVILNENDDCCFQTRRTRPVIYDAVVPTYRKLGAADNFETYNNTDPGTHNYDADNRAQLYRFLNRHFDLQTPEHDLHREEEIYTEQELEVGLPVDQQTMRSLALRRARELERGHRLPHTKRERAALRRRLRAVLRLPQYELPRRARAIGEDAHVLRLGPWSVTLFIRQGGPDEPVELFVDDLGRESYYKNKPKPKRTFIAAEILDIGSDRLSIGAGMLLETCGHRLLGIQVGQLLACARFAQRQSGQQRIELRVIGRRSALAGLIAAALEPALFSRLITAHDTPRLRYLIEWSTHYADIAPLCCFGLLKVADTPQLLALLEDVVYEPLQRAVKAAVPVAAR